MQTYSGSPDGRDGESVSVQVEEQEQSNLPDSIQVAMITEYLNKNLKTMEYDDLCGVGLEARNLRDFSNIVIGRLALEIGTRSGDKALGDFARQLGLKPETVFQYRWVASKFPGLKTYDGLSFSYYRLAAGTEDPEGWIQKAIDGGWTISILQQKIKGRPLMMDCEHKEIIREYRERCSDCGKMLLKTRIFQTEALT